MAHFTGQRLSHCMLLMLALASPLVARGDAGRLAPVIDLDPHHREATTSPHTEPEALIVVAETMPLPANMTPPADPIANTPSDLSAGQKLRQPTIQLAAPFHPESGAAPQTRIGPEKQSSFVPALQGRTPRLPVVRDAETIHPVQNLKSNRSTKIADQGIIPNEPVATVNPVRERITHAASPATRKTQVRRQGGPRTQPLPGHDLRAAETLAELKSLPQSNPVALNADRSVTQTSSAEPSPAVDPPRRSGIVQLAAQDPTALNRESETPRPSAPRKLATEVLRRSTSIVTPAARPPIAPRQTRTAMASNSGGGSAPAAAEVSPAKPLVLRESELGLTTSSRTQSLPVVQPAKKPSTGQLPTAQALLQPPITTQREPVVKLVEQNVPERRVSAEPLVQVPLRTVASRPLLRLADAEPLLAVLQPPSSATELPPPPDGTTTVDPPADSEELVDAFLVSKSIHELSTRITPEAGDLPKDYAAARFAREDNIPHPMGYSRTEVETLKTWEAPALCYRPLYFEDINLERYGYKLPLIQPALSAAHFFGRVPLLPYLMVSEGHFRCQYALGHYRPGDYAPYSLYIPRLRLDASAAEAAVAAAAILIVP